ncbi:hypothetical protein G7046_g9129 [Stylonectria norvegica]|nr:hypothetical protein G7046_g9129 [Stylonectria norvegica]
MALSSNLNTLERKAEIDTFLSSLSPWELLRVRGHLRNISPKFAGLEDLPPEVLIEIVPYLGVKDVLDCCLVSKSWARSWTHNAVLGALCHHNFAGLRDIRPSTDLKELFVKTARRRLARKTARFKKKIIPWDASWSTSEFTNENPMPPSMKTDTAPALVGVNHPIRYADGKVAWRPNRDLVIIDDLRTRSRQRCTLGHLALHVQHLGHKAWKQISLPGPFAKCYVQRDTIGLVTKTKRVIIWTWQGTASQLIFQENEHGGRENGRSPLFGGLPGLIIHPTLPDVVYVIWAYLLEGNDENMAALTIVKFESGVATWKSQGSISHSSVGSDRNLDPAISFICRKENSHGTYTLTVSRAIDCGHHVSERRMWRCHDVNGDLRFAGWNAVSFNIFTQKCSQSYYYDGAIKNGMWWDLNEDLAPPCCAGDNKNVIQDATIWNHDLHFSVFTKTRSRPDDLSSPQFQQSYHKYYPCMTIRPLTSTDDAGMTGTFETVPTPYEPSDTMQQGELFIDDDFAIVRLRAGLVVWTQDVRQAPGLAEDTEEATEADHFDSDANASDVDDDYWEQLQGPYVTEDTDTISSREDRYWATFTSPE